MAPGSRCTGILSETWLILPITPKFAHPNSLIWKHFEDSYTLLRIFLDSVPQLLEYPGAPVKWSRSTWEHIALRSVYLGASGSIWKDHCGCSELLSCSVMTSKPFYILLMIPSQSPWWLRATYCMYYSSAKQWSIFASRSRLVWEFWNRRTGWEYWWLWSRLRLSGGFQPVPGWIAGGSGLW